MNSISSPALGVGEVLVWSPQWLKLFARVKVNPKGTFDASRTPELGTSETAPPLAPIDLPWLDQALRATVDPGIARDPAALRKRLEVVTAQRDELRRQLEERPDPHQVLALEGALQQIAGTVQGALEQVRALRAGAVPREPAPVREPLPEGGPPGPVLRAQRETTLPRRHEENQGPTAPAGPPLKGPRRILWALASRRPAALSRAQVATLAGFKPDSGTFSNYLSELRTKLLLQEQGRRLTITQTGVLLLGAHCPSGPASTGEIVALWKSKLTGAAKTLLDLLVSVYPQGLSREGLASQAGLSASSGTFTNYLSALRVSGLVEDARFSATGHRIIRASPTLFPP